MRTRVLLADDHRLVLDGVRRALEDAEDLEIVGEAVHGTQVLPLVNRLRPNVVLLDIRMAGIDGLTLTELIRKRFPEVKVIVLSIYADKEHIAAALNRGASGYIVKSVNPSDLAPAIRQAMEQTVYHALGMPEPTRDADLGLTERELVVLRAVARGASNGAIARELWVTEKTVKFHLTNIYGKLGVTNRTEAARAAFRHGIAESPLTETI